jgi:poly-gamma-glutamate synthesis protein (capsule biosynthesis protein)
MRLNRLVFVLLLLALLLASCSDQAPAPVAEAATPAPASSTPVAPTATASPTAMPTASPTATETPAPTATPTPAYEVVRLAVDEALAAYDPTALDALAALDLREAGYALELAPEQTATHRLRLALAEQAPAPGEDVYPLGVHVYVIVAPFDDLRDELTLDELRLRWAGQGQGALLASQETAALFAAAWGPGEPQLVADEALLAALLADADAVGLLPFDALAPTFKALRLDGASPLDRELDMADYPLALALWLEGAGADEIGPLVAAPWDGWANRDPERMTELIMTGVTAMCRLTADRMERYGVLYPAQVISDVLRAADITHVSNEVPFVKGCPVNTASGNLTFCSDYPYWGALEAIGTDIVGLSGNHVNDYGYAGARESIAFYRERGIPIYGSGLNEEEACAPLFIEHNGNRLAFIATLAFEPSWAWATDELPGACYFYNNKERLLALISELDADPEVDLVAIELQYLETYNPYPTAQQVEEFRELREVGADIVTGVQSHVPQAWEPYDASSAQGPGIIVYGLGNLFFDQMWSWETRTGLIARHTIYQGRLLHSEILTTVLEDYAQPRWATPEERLEILQRIHQAAPPLAGPATP